MTLVGDDVVGTEEVVGVVDVVVVSASVDVVAGPTSVVLTLSSLVELGPLTGSGSAQANANKTHRTNTDFRAYDFTERVSNRWRRT